MTTFSSLHPRLPAAVQSAFTLIELLAVIAIIGVLAALIGPAVVNIRKGDAMLAANRQMLGAVARARQLAMANHTTVYMVFLPTNFWGGFSATWLTDPTKFSERVAATNLAEKQLTGYNFISLRSAGDQPGQGVVRYHSQWQTLPESTFIPEWKFTRNPFEYRTVFNVIGPPVPSSPRQEYRIYGFDCTTNIPFPLESAARSNGPYPSLPYIAFNYLGQPIGVDDQPLAADLFIPLAHGSVAHVLDLAKRPTLDPPSALEKPLGNSTNNFNLIRIDRFTGRARLERQEIY